MTEKDAKAFQNDISGDSRIFCLIDENEQEDAHKTPPTKLKNPKLFKPFEMSDQNAQGLPAYGRDGSTGHPLRAGKSFLIYQRIQQLLTEGVGWDSMLYINFEDERLDGLQVSELNLIIEAHLEMYGKRPILFLDEIQNIEGWEKFARRLADEKYKVYITGSNAKMLSSDIQTTLGGRYITINVYPYSFPEFLEVHHTAYDELSLLGTESRAAVMNRFIDYFHNGGFPEGALLAAKRNYLTSVYQKIYLGDIAARNAITNTFGLKIMIKKLAESIKQPISFNRIANIVSTTGSKLSTTSAIKYVEYAESAWLLQRINKLARAQAAKMYFRLSGIN